VSSTELIHRIIPVGSTSWFARKKPAHIRLQSTTDKGSSSAMLEITVSDRQMKEGCRNQKDNTDHGNYKNTTQLALRKTKNLHFIFIVWMPSRQAVRYDGATDQVLGRSVSLPHVKLKGQTLRGGTVKRACQPDYLSATGRL
jgi:hypothetical protein